MSVEVTDSVDYAGWAIAMCTLLDRIEMVADDEAAVRSLVAGRFRIAEQYGLETVFLGLDLGAGAVQ